LHLLSDLPAVPVAMALVKLAQTGSTTVEVRTLHNGYFAAQVRAGAVTVTAYPPDQVQHSTSAPVNVTAVKGQVTKVDGTATGAPPTIKPADFMPCHLGDKKATSLIGWEEGYGGGDHASTDWLFFVIGTTSIDGETAYVMADPRGDKAPVITMQAGGPEVISNGSRILRPAADGSVTLYGMCEVVRNPDATYEAIGTMFSPPIVYPVMTLGKQYTTTTAAHQRTITIDLMAGLSLADLYDPTVADTRYLEPSEGPLVWTTRLTGIGVPVGTPADTFTDTIVLSETTESTYPDAIETQTYQAILARNVGMVAMDIVTVSRDVGQPSGTDRVIQWSHDLLIYARVGGAEWGTVPAPE